jgi:hypothetical protein
MNTRRNYIMLVLSLLLIVGCGKKESSMTNEEKIAGEDSKTWKAKRETTGAGSVDRLNRDEKRQEITFWRNGNVKMGDGNQTMTGQWSLEGNTLKLQFTGADVTENFNVLELDKDEMKLQAGDGSTMTMKPD